MVHWYKSDNKKELPRHIAEKKKKLQNNMIPYLFSKLKGHICTCLCIPLKKSGVIERSGQINSKLLIAVNLKEQRWWGEWE